MTNHYWAVRPVSTRETGDNTRIEQAATALRAYELAFGRGNPMGRFEAKDMGSQVAVIRSSKRRHELLRDPNGWQTLGSDRTLTKIERLERAMVSEYIRQGDVISIMFEMLCAIAQGHSFNEGAYRTFIETARAFCESCNWPPFSEIERFQFSKRREHKQSA